jgi:uncharacterized protein (TIGR02145 family)
VLDFDGNKYYAVTIGTETWLTSNLKITHFNTGDPVPLVTSNLGWSALTKAAYCNYSNNAALANSYGNLYNYYAVTDNRMLCPSGWHVPTKEEWTSLLDSLGGVLKANGKMREPGTVHWFSPNAGANNESGLSILPAGFRLSSDGFFNGLGLISELWSSTTFDSGLAYLFYLSQDVAGVFQYEKKFGVSVRCKKD